MVTTRELKIFSSINPILLYPKFKWVTFHSNYGAILYGLRDSDLLVENREIFIPHLYIAPLQG